LKVHIRLGQDTSAAKWVYVCTHVVHNYNSATAWAEGSISGCCHCRSRLSLWLRSQAAGAERVKGEPGADGAPGAGAGGSGAGGGGAGGGGRVGPDAEESGARAAAQPFPVGPAGFMPAAQVNTSLDSARRPPAA